MPQSTITFETCASQGLPIPVFAPAGIALAPNGTAVNPAPLTNGAITSFTVKAGQLIRVTAPSAADLNVIASSSNVTPALGTILAAHYLKSGVFIDFISPDDGNGNSYIYVVPSANVTQGWAPGRLTGAEVHL